jgi:predicted DNA-binding antitoxin AbrB/MazE fold protein
MPWLPLDLGSIADFAWSPEARYTISMSQEIRAIYENGLFRPLDPVSLTDHDVVSLIVNPALKSNSTTERESLELQRQALCEALDEADRLPLESPDDGFSGADHDLILYGWKK